ncbi:MAG: hypothetical protein JNK23_04505 [Opitutaceae bacterium]|nr:hypothetical protein [Opitutaceae bacterium]
MFIVALTGPECSALTSMQVAHDAASASRQLAAHFGEHLRLAPRLQGALCDFRVYDRALQTTEAL